jgi:pyridoxal phosphate enzyme (YggS family)
MIGTLQRNKAREAVRFFDIVHSVDRPELAQALEHALSEEPTARKLPVLLQVNSTAEPTKSGVSPEALQDLAAALSRCPHLQPAGLMTIARLGADEVELRGTFSLMRRLLEGLQPSFPTMQHLSMGMTDDYEIAIEEGATMVRIGRAIFGERL